MKSKKFLIIYGIIILIILIVILFILPDKFFKKEPTKIELVDDTISLQEQMKNVNNNHYKYKYLVQYSIHKSDDTYKCTGEKNGDTENGECTSPSNTKYTEENKEEVFKDIVVDYLDPSYLFELIKDITPEERNLGDTMLYIYKLTLDKFDTEITIYSDYKSITQVELTNMYGTYVITLSEIS